MEFPESGTPPTISAPSLGLSPTLTAKVSSAMVHQTQIASPPQFQSDTKTTIKSVNEIPMNIDHTVHTAHDCKHSLSSLNTPLSSMSPLPSLGLSPTLSPKSTSSLKRTSGIRSPSASMSPSKFGRKPGTKSTLSTSSKQEIHPLPLHQEQ